MDAIFHLLRYTAAGRRGATIAGAVVLTLAALVSGFALAQNTEPPAIVNAENATVYLMQTYSQAGSEAVSCVGSGTLVSPNGLILTNAHLVEAVGPCRGERVLVALSVRPNEPPVATYLAHIVQVDSTLDLAVIQIVSGLDGSSIDPKTLNLPFVSVGDPSTLAVGSSLTYVGYPDTGQSNVAAVEGPITGIAAEKAGSQSAWLRTGAALGGAMAGGGAFDANGSLLGVLTSAPGTDGLTVGTDCLSIQDNNHDGVINDRDACAPVGHSVTLIRPINFAIPLIESATNGFALDRLPGFPETPLTSAPVIKRLFFSEGITDQGLPAHVTDSLQSGAKSVYVFFDYQDMRPGTSYELRVTSGGADVPSLDLGPLSWGGGRNGTWYIGNDNAPLPDGTYEFTLFLAGQAAAVGKLTVGGGAPEPTFRNLAFTANGSSSASASGSALFPVQGTQQITASFSYDGMKTGQDWTEIWYLDGSEIFRATHLWDHDVQGQLSVTASNLAGLPLGTYRLELMIGQRLAATGDVSLVGNRGQQGQAIAFSNVRISSDKTRDGLPAGTTGAAMPLGINSLYLFVDWDNMPTGVPWTYRWFLDGKLVSSSTQLWDNGGVGQNLWLSLSSTQPLAEGTYSVEILVEGTPMLPGATVTIGGGTRAPTGIQNSNDVVNITGTVTDALTGQGIPGALVTVLNVNFVSAQFSGNEAQIYSEGISDQRGRFSLSKGLPRSNYYTFYVYADGYTTIVEDTFIILQAQTSPVDISIQMNHP